MTLEREKYIRPSRRNRRVAERIKEGYVLGARLIGRFNTTLTAGLSVAQKLDFYSMPEPNSGCYIWIGLLTRGGYGTLRFNNKNRRAHRLAWQESRGEIPDGLHVLHKCDNRACVNPAHLWLGTNAQNWADCQKKGRSRFLRGTDLPQAKLNERLILAIRRASGRHRDIGEKFGIGQSHVSQIKRREIWGHIP